METTFEKDGKKYEAIKSPNDAEECNGCAFAGKFEKCIQGPECVCDHMYYIWVEVE